jgi:hypothetical protein
MFFNSQKLAKWGYGWSQSRLHQKIEIRKKNLEFGKCHSHGCWNLQVRSTAEFSFRARRLAVWTYWDARMAFVGGAGAGAGAFESCVPWASQTLSGRNWRTRVVVIQRFSQSWILLFLRILVLFFFLILVERGGRLRGFSVVVVAAAVVTTSLVAPFWRSLDSSEEQRRNWSLLVV